MIVGPRERLGIKFKDIMCAELHLKATSILVTLLNQMVYFESDCPATKFQAIT